METERETTEREVGQKEITGREDSIRREYDFAPDVKLKECRYCRVMIPKKAKVCPNCRMNLKGHWFRNLVAAVFAVTVIGAGGYYLSEHWGIMKDAVASVWMAQDRSAVPVMSMTTVDSTKTAAEPVAATTEVARMSEEAETQAQPAESQTDAEAETTGLNVKAGSRNESAAVEAEQIGDKNDTKTIEEIEGENDAEPAETKDTENRNDAASAQTEDIENRNDAESVKAQGREQEEQKTAETQADTEDAYSEPDGMDGQTEEENGIKEQERTADESRGRQQERAVDKQELAFREDCVTVSYKSLLRATETYLDRALMVEVQVVCQVNGGLFDDNIYYFCKTEDAGKIERYYIVRDDRETDDTIILEGDILTVFGQLFGTCKIPAELIETRPTVPAVSMLYYDLMGE